MPRIASPSRVAGFRLVFFLAACCLVVPTGPGKPDPVATGPSYLFLSSNRDENLSLADVRVRLRSSSQQHYHLLARQILQHLGVDGAEVHDAVGDWSDGVENSLLVVLPRSANPEALRCAAAWFGLMAEQKAVLAFHADPAGRASLTVIDLPEHNLTSVRRLLDQHGVRDRTILVGPHASRVVVLDADGRLVQALAAAAHSAGGRLHVHAGRSESLTGATRPLARQRYREVIRGFQTSRTLPVLLFGGKTSR